MSRASEITLFIILLQASIGFVDASGIFDAHYIDIPENNASYTISDLSDYSVREESEGLTGIITSVDLFAQWAWESFWIGVKIIFAVVFIFPTLVSSFGVPAILATFIQVGIYFVYATWFSQYKSGRGWKLYE